jgi:DNA-binding transcriptional MerR regulator
MCYDGGVPALADRPAAKLRRIGDVVALTGLTARAIRYYEEIGLLRPATHVAGTNRRYDDDDVGRLRRIKLLRETVGLSLADVQTFLETDDVRRCLRQRYIDAPTPAERLSTLDRALSIIQRRVDLLERKRSAVDDLLNEEREQFERLSQLRGHEALDRNPSEPED